MSRRLGILVLAAVASMSFQHQVLAESGPGSCGKGQIWDADLNKCVKKPKSTGSHAG